MHTPPDYKIQPREPKLNENANNITKLPTAVLSNLLVPADVGLLLSLALPPEFEPEEEEGAVDGEEVEEEEGAVVMGVGEGIAAVLFA